MKKLLIMLFACLLLVGCGPSQEEIDKAFAETQTSLAPTITLTPTITYTPTITPTPTITLTPTATMTPTPDIRAIEGEPKDFILTRLDLPSAGGYFLTSTRWVGRYSNEEVIGSWGRKEGTEFIMKSGRIDGWYVNYQRGLKSTSLPLLVYCIVEKFETSQGAKMTLEDQYNWLAKPPYYYKMTRSTDTFSGLGDNYVSYFREWTEDNGDKFIAYAVYATYFNFSTSCMGQDYKKQLDPEFVAKLVNIIIQRMKYAPLVIPTPSD